MDVDHISRKPSSRTPHPSNWRRKSVRADNWIKPQEPRRKQLAELISTRQAPIQSDKLEAAIARSSYIRGLRDNWNEDGGTAISPETWDRAVTFLRKSAESLLREHGTRIDVPQITPEPSGSIDIHWQTDQFLMLINIRPEGPSDFYGETPDGLTIKGTFVPETHHQGILSWLKEQTR